MQVKVFTLPFESEKGIFQEEDLNRFLDTQRVLSVKEGFFSQNGHNFWTVFVQYELPVAPAPNPKATMNEEEQALYKRLTQWRREQAQTQGVPSYIVAANKELEALVLTRPASLEQMKTINGFGRKKLERYGKMLLQLVRPEKQ